MKTTEGTKLAAECRTCDRPTIHTQQGEVDRGPDDDRGWEEPVNVVLASCDVCGDVLVLMQYWDQNADGWSGMEPVWPREQLWLPPGVPFRVHNTFIEAQRCHKTKSYQAAAMMVRKTVELACEERGYKEYKLINSIKKMKEAGVIEGRLFDWADALREIGNEGAHERNPPARQDVEDALDFTRTLLDYLYVMSAKFDEFTARRNPPAVVAPAASNP